MRKGIVIIVCLCLLMTLCTGCSKGDQASQRSELEVTKELTTEQPTEPPTEKMTAKAEPADTSSVKVEERELDGAFADMYGTMTWSMLSEAYADCNACVSPASLLFALGMLENGAANETLAQMETMLGGIPCDALNEYLFTLAKQMQASEESKVSVANSLWCKATDGFAFKKDFVDRCAAYYQASVYREAFDEQTLKAINSWCNDKTKGMIPSILDKIDDDARVYLLNALCFESAWEVEYEETAIREEVPFYNEARTEEVRKVTMLNSEEHNYLENDYVTGFAKPYKGGDYLFVGLLPKEGLTMDEVLSGMSENGLTELLEASSKETVRVSFPEFKAEFGMSCSDWLKKLGMTDAFGPTADFSREAEREMYVSMVYQKTFIEVSREGTKAAAVTIIQQNDTCAMEEQPKQVYLDRPFLYAIVEASTNTPVFVGVWGK